MIDELDHRGVGFRALNSPMDTTEPAGRAFLQIQAAFAEMERNIIRQRIREGVKAARARGRKGGRPRVMTPEKLRYARNLMADQTRSIPDICCELGSIPASTLYHYLPLTTPTARSRNQVDACSTSAARCGIERPRRRSRCQTMRVSPGRSSATGGIVAEDEIADSGFWDVELQLHILRRGADPGVPDGSARSRLRSQKKGRHE